MLIFHIQCVPCGTLERYFCYAYIHTANRFISIHTHIQHIVSRFPFLFFAAAAHPWIHVLSTSNTLNGSSREEREKKTWLCHSITIYHLPHIERTTSTHTFVKCAIILYNLYPRTGSTHPKKWHIRMYTLNPF